MDRSVPTIKRLLSIGATSDKSQYKVGGLIRYRRLQGNRTAFLCLYDGTCYEDLQCVCSSTILTPDEWHLVQNINIGSSAEVTGYMVVSPAKGQKWEFSVLSIRLIGDCPSETYPMIKKDFTLEFFRKYPHLRGRTRVGSAVMRIRSTLSLATHDFYRDRDFTYLHTPLITGSDCEGAGETFRVSSDARSKTDKVREFFGKPAFLTVSGQLNAETYACGMSRVYTFGPTFRADNSNTTRHLAEFWMIEPEIAFCDLEGLMNLAESYVKYCLRAVFEKNNDDLVFLDKQSPGLFTRLERIINEPFIKLSYTNAIDQLQFYQKTSADASYEHVVWGTDLKSEHEKYLVDVVYKGLPVILYNYPSDIKSFYMKENLLDENLRSTVAAMDLLVPGIGELIGGSQRETDIEILSNKMLNRGLKLEDYKEYLDIRRYGNMPHSGFGLGLERLVMLATGMTNIRDVIPFPRYVDHLEF
jgi:asparaginyl-tRNA synthetase